MRLLSILIKSVFEELLNLDYSAVTRYLISRIRNKVSETGFDKVVVGLSGGLDSSVTVKLLTEALESSRVLALIMPDSRVTDKADVEDAVNLAESLGVNYRILNIDGIVDEYAKILGVDDYESIPIGNLRTRIRMSILYYYANTTKALVAGTSDKSEILIGYFTKYGDGAADFYPIACLYKSQVRRLAEYLGLPSRIIHKPSSPGFWRGHLAEEEIGLKYEVIDSILYLLFDKKLSIDEIITNYNFDRDVVVKVLSMFRRSMHKRVLINEEDLYLPNPPI